MIVDRFNIVLVQPNYEKFTTLNAYQEVIDSLHFSLNEIGAGCSKSINTIDPHRRNIVFGWEVAFQFAEFSGRKTLETLFPANTILFCLEQYAGLNFPEGHRLYRAAKTYEIWDFSKANIQTWEKIVPLHSIFYCPIGYSPILEKLHKRDLEDFDVSFIGRLDKFRFEVIEKINSKQNLNYYGISTFANVWGELRNEIIERSKIMLNISAGTENIRIFEIVRIAYYLANKKAVVSTINSNTFIENDLQKILFLKSPDSVHEILEWLLENKKNRDDYGQYSYELFKKLDLRIFVYEYFK